MGFVVLHMEKAHGSDSGTTAHIERFIIPKNADPTRTHLNRKLIEYPEGVKDRSAAIQRRLEEAGLTRKIGSNQVRAKPEQSQRGVLTTIRSNAPSCSFSFASREENAVAVQQ